MKNNTQLQGIVSIAALACLVIGWFDFAIIPAELKSFLYNQAFYILIGVSFFLQAPTLANPKYIYPMYAAAALCAIGALLPQNLGLSFLKTIGLFGGVIISLIGRPRVQRDS